MKLVELRRDAHHQLWAFYADGTVWPHGVLRPDEDAAAWAHMHRRHVQWLNQRERVAMGREDAA